MALSESSLESLIFTNLKDKFEPKFSGLDPSQESDARANMEDIANSIAKAVVEHITTDGIARIPIGSFCEDASGCVTNTAPVDLAII